MRQIPPGTTRARDVEDRVEHQPSLVARRTAQLAFDRQQASHDLPFDIRQLAGVGFDFRHPKPSTPPQPLVQVSFSSQADFLHSLSDIVKVDLRSREARKSNLLFFASLVALMTQKYC